MTSLPSRQRAQLPDRAFAYVDSRGRRRLPIHDAAHVRNALARFNQVMFEDEESRERARDKLLRASRKHGIVPLGFISGQLRTRRKGPLPHGPVTFLLADVEGSTALLRTLEDAYQPLLDEILRTLRNAARRMGGHEIGVHGDEFFAAFRHAPDALLSALAMHRALRDSEWPSGAVVRVRIGLHAGRPTLTEDGYTGLAVHAIARIATAGHGGQILLSEAALRALGDPLPPDIAIRDLGSIHLRGLSREQLFQVVVPDLPSDFPPLRIALAS